ncbi:MAG: tetratricopeptide repeat protein [Myxococcota bacterium]
MSVWVMLLACSLRQPPSAAADSVEEPPAWSTEDGAEGARFALIEALIDNQQPEAALEMIRAVESKGYGTPELDILQARALRTIGLYEDAELLLAQVLRRQRRSASAHNEMGILKMDQARLEEAIDSFTRAQKLSETNADYANNLGFALMVNDQPGEAVVVLREALKHDATRERTRNNLAFALIQDGRPKEGYRVFRSAMPEAEARYNLGVGLELRGDLEDAQVAYTAALNANPEHVRAREALTRIQP